MLIGSPGHQLSVTFRPVSSSMYMAAVDGLEPSLRELEARLSTPAHGGSLSSRAVCTASRDSRIDTTDKRVVVVRQRASADRLERRRPHAAYKPASTMPTAGRRGDGRNVRVDRRQDRLDRRVRRRLHKRQGRVATRGVHTRILGEVRNDRACPIVLANAEPARIPAMRPSACVELTCDPGKRPLPVVAVHALTNQGADARGNRIPHNAAHRAKNLQRSDVELAGPVIVVLTREKPVRKAAKKVSDAAWLGCHGCLRRYERAEYRG